MDWDRWQSTTTVIDNMLLHCSTSSLSENKMRYFHILLIVQFPLAFSLHLEESVLENGRSGTDVVLLSIAYIHQVEIFQDDNNLLRRITRMEHI